MQKVKILTATCQNRSVAIMASESGEKLLDYLEQMKKAHPEFEELGVTYHITEEAVPVI